MRLLSFTPEQLQRSLRENAAAAASAKREEERLASLDEFDPEAQAAALEKIRQAGIEASYAHAMENAPELVVGQVFMLYIRGELNGHALKLFVDSGAQMTIMSRACAEATGVMRMVDKRFEGEARGVGTQKIIGRVHAAQLKLGGAFLDVSFSVLEKDDEPQIILGLDMLKRHQCCIDLKRNALIVGTTGEVVPFLPEHELPRGAFGRAGDGGSQEEAGSTPPAAAPQGAAAAGGGAPPASDAVRQLMGMGFSESQAVQALAACGGNVDQAASLLFE